jgi:hypothetical protein
MVVDDRDLEGILLQKPKDTQRDDDPGTDFTCEHLAVKTIWKQYKDGCKPL